jgi:hypothetical protein
LNRITVKKYTKEKLNCEIMFFNKTYVNDFSNGTIPGSPSWTILATHAYYKVVG